MVPCESRPFARKCFIREFPVSCVGVRFLISREPCHAGAFASSASGYIVQNCFARRQPRENRESGCYSGDVIIDAVLFSCMVAFITGVVLVAVNFIS